MLTLSPVHLSTGKTEFDSGFGLGLRYRRLCKPEGKHPIALVWRAVKSSPIFQGGDEDFKPSHPIPGECGNPPISLLAGVEEGAALGKAHLYAGVREIWSLFIPSMHAPLLWALKILLHVLWCFCPWRHTSPSPSKDPDHAFCQMFLGIILLAWPSRDKEQ